MQLRSHAKKYIRVQIIHICTYRVKISACERGLKQKTKTAKRNIEPKLTRNRKCCQPFVREWSQIPEKCTK